MTDDARKIHIMLAQHLVDFVLDEDIVVATRLTLEEATALVNAHFESQPRLGDLDQEARDVVAREIIQSELESRYHAEKARRVWGLH